MALMFVTHDLGVAAQIADRVAVMYAGRIVEEGSAQRRAAQSAPSLHDRHAGLDHAGPRARPRYRGDPRQPARYARCCRRAAASRRAAGSRPLPAARRCRRCRDGRAGPYCGLPARCRSFVICQARPCHDARRQRLIRRRLLMDTKTKIRVAHLAGPNATIQNTPPLVTSNKARQKHGLPPLTSRGWQRPEVRRAAHAASRRAGQSLCRAILRSSARARRRRALRPARRLYRCRRPFPQGTARRRRTSRSTRSSCARRRPLSAALYGACRPTASLGKRNAPSLSAPAEQARQGFFPDGSRSFEEIDRLSIERRRQGEHRSLRWRRSISIACCRRAATRKGLPAALRTDVGEGDIPPETRGKDFFPYKPRHLGVGAAAAGAGARHQHRAKGDVERPI